MLLLFLVLGSNLASADSWLYTFSGTNSAQGGDGLAVSFEYSVQDPILANTSLLSTQLISCTNCLISTLVPAIVFDTNNVFGSTVQFNDSTNTANEFVFPFGAFVKPGTYFSAIPFNTGTLTVKVVPEPSSIFLFASGFWAIGCAARRKLRK
jgi:PEP-CTERM motif